MSDAAYTIIAATVLSIVAQVLTYLKARDAVVLGTTNARAIDAVNDKADASAAKGVHVADALADIQLKVNGNLEKFIRLAEQGGLSKGIAQGASEERDRTAVLLAGVRSDAALASAQANMAANTASMDANTAAVDHNTERRGP